MSKFNIFYFIYTVYLSLAVPKKKLWSISFLRYTTQYSRTSKSRQCDSIDEGQRITLTASANDGHAFIGWEGTINESTNPLTIEGNKNYTLTANFRVLPQLTDEVLIYDYERIDTLPIFAIENGGTKAYYLNKDGSKGESYTFDLRLGNDITPEENGNLLGIFKPQNDPPFTFGGGGGILRELTTSNQIVWEYNTINENEIAHHDLTKLPNGNVLTLIWERSPLAEARRSRSKYHK